MTGIFSKLWPGFALAVILGMACLLLYSKCNTPKPGPDVGQAVQTAIQHGYDSAKSVDTPAIIQLTAEKDSLYDMTNQLRAGQLILQYTIDTLGDRIGRTMAATDEARIKHDTVEVLQNCDSLEAEVKRGIPAVTGYTTLTDSLVKTYVAEVVVQDSIIAKLTRDNAIAGKTITAQGLAYQIVSKDDVHKTAELRIYKPAAVGSVATIIAYITLKILLKK